MAKKLSKPLWYGTDIDATGQPLLPPATTNPGDLDGLHKGELFMHLKEDEVTLWGVSLNGKVVKITGKSDEVNINLSDYLKKEVWDSVWEIREDTSGQKYIYGKLPVVTQYGVTMYADNGSLDIPSIYDGLPIDNSTLVWRDDVLMVNPDLEFGLNEDELAEYLTTHNYITDAYVDKSINTLETSVDKSIKAIRSYVDSNFVTFANDETITGLKDFTKGIKIDGLPITKLQGDVLYIDSNVVIRGGLTMYYEDGEIDLPTIKDEIGNAGYDGVTGLASFDSSQFVIGTDGTVSIISGSSGLNTEELKSYLDTNKYTTETWVKEQGYASASSLSSLQKKVNDFLEGSDTDTIINKWKELEIFLSGLLESDNLATILSTKWTTDNNLINQWNTAYGWGDHSKVGYALKSYVDGELAKYVTLGTKQTITGEKNFTGGLKVNGSPIYYDATNKYWKLEGDLLVTGGVSMYSDDSAFTPSTIMDGVVVDGTSIRKNPTTGALEVIGGSGSTTKYPLSWSGFSSGSYDGSVAQSFYIPTKLSEFINDSGFITSASIPTKLSQLTDDVVSGKYLPLSGGKLRTTTSNIVLVLDAYSMGDQNYLQFYNASYSLGYLGFSAKDNPVYRTPSGTNYKLWHSGNDGAGSGLDADLLDGVQPSELNVGSATKLQTPRTIWGQSFDGSANVTGNLVVGDGNLILNNNKALQWKNTNGENVSIITYSNNNALSIGTGVAQKSRPLYIRGMNVYLQYGTNHTPGLYIKNTGNVLIGTETDSGYKLDVNGSIHTNSRLLVDTIPIYKSQDDVLYIDGNLVVRGGVTMYGENEVDIPTLMDAIAVDATMYNEGGILGVVKASTTKAGAAMFDSNFFSVDDNGLVTLTNAPSSVSTLGSLLNVDVSVDSTANADMVLFKAANSSTWVYKNVNDIINGGGSSGATGDVLSAKFGSYSANSIYDFYYTGVQDGDGLPSAIPYGSLLTLPYRKAFGNTIPDFAAQIYIPNGDDSSPFLFFRTSLGASWNEWQHVVSVNSSGVVTVPVKFYTDTLIVESKGLNSYVAYKSLNSSVYFGDIGFHRDSGLASIWMASTGWRPIIYGADYNGNLVVTGGITMYSDIRKKQKLQDVELSLSQIANAPLIEHYYLSDQDKTTHVGSIAQYWAGLNDWFCKKDAEGYYTMEIQNAALASAISIARHLERYESKTDKKIRQLKKRISQLEGEIEKLKSA